MICDYAPHACTLDLIRVLQPPARTRHLCPQHPSPMRESPCGNTTVVPCLCFLPFCVPLWPLLCVNPPGPQHACAIARALKIRSVLVHRLCGILSAYGMGLADEAAEAQEPCSLPYSLPPHHPGPG